MPFFIGANVVRARADLLTTKLGIILSLSFFLSFFFLPRTVLPEGICQRSCQKKIAGTPPPMYQTVSIIKTDLEQDVKSCHFSK